MSKPARGVATPIRLVAWAACAVGCAGGSEITKPKAARAPLSVEGSSEASYVSPAHFRYHPRERARTLTERSLPDGGKLFAGERGERWLFDPGSGRLLPGAMLAPEPLIAILFDAENTSFSFVGPSGTSYIARGPVAAFDRSSAPVEALNGVTAAGSAILGVRQSRTLLRSPDFGASWVNAGPQKQAIVDVAVNSKGQGLALAVPEALFATSDFGESFHPLEIGSSAALELGVGVDDSLRVFTPFGERVYDPARGQLVAARPSKAIPDAGLPPPSRGPDAGALAVGRAALSRGRYYEASLTSSAGGVWELWSGAFDGALTRTPLDVVKGCRAVRLAAFDPYVLLACFRQAAESTSQSIELFRSDSRGERFEQLSGRLDGTLSAFRLAVGAGGHWLLSGVCAPGLAASGCAVNGIQRERRAEDVEAPAPVSSAGKPRATNGPPLGALSAAPSLADSALALGFSADGKIAYAVGRRTKTARFAMFVSEDGGKHFEPEDLDLGQIASEDSEDDFVERSPGTRVESLSAAEDGAVALIFAHYGRRTLVVTDEHAKQLSSAEAPEDHALLSASGLRALAIAHKSRELWESLDGGVSWTPSALLPIELCPDKDSCEVPLRCEPSGCVIGNQLSRVGWAGQSSQDAVLLPPPLRPLRAPADRRFRTPISCALEPAPFTRLSGVMELPSADHAAIGQSSWFVITEDITRAQANIVVAKKNRLETSNVLEPVPHPEQYAIAVYPQVEGVAALRYRLPELEPVHTTLSDVEVAWSNLFENRFVRARVADAGPYSPGDYVNQNSRAQRAEPDLLSIAAGGLYLRIHRASRSDQPTLFLDGRQVSSLPTPTWPRDTRYPGRSEMVHVDGAHVPIQLVGRGAAVLRARRTGPGFAFDGYATGMIDPASFGLIELERPTYVGNRFSLYLEVQDAAGVQSEARVFPLRADGAVVDAPVLVPSQRSLGDGLPACDAARRAQTPRVIASFQPGTRHPVLVSDSVDAPRVLLTGSNVLFGDPSSPCVAALDAATPTPDGGQPPREGALIFPEDLEHSVFFRVASASSGDLEFRYMSCKLDPSVEIPSEVYRSLR